MVGRAFANTLENYSVITVRHPTETLWMRFIATRHLSHALEFLLSSGTWENWTQTKAWSHRELLPARGELLRIDDEGNFHIPLLWTFPFLIRSAIVSIYQTNGGMRVMMMMMMMKTGMEIFWQGRNLAVYVKRDFWMRMLGVMTDGEEKW